MSTPQAYALSRQQAYLWRTSTFPSQRRHQVTLRAPHTDPVALQAMLDDLSSNHEILRTTFADAAGMNVGVQKVHDALRIEVSTGSNNEGEARLNAMTSPWHCTTASPLRIDVVGDSIVVTALALALDPESLMNFCDRLIGASTLRSHDPLQYPDFVTWQQELGADETSADAHTRWQARQPESVAPLPFRIDNAAALSPTARRTDVVAVDIALHIEKLDSIAAVYGCNRSDLISTAFHVFVHRASDSPMSAIADWFGVAGRDDFAASFGNFGAYRPSTLDFKTDPTFLQALDAHTRLLRADAPRCDTLEPGVSDSAQFGPLEHRIIAIDAASPTSAVSSWIFDIDQASISLQVMGGRAQIVWNSAVFDHAAVTRFAHQLEALIAAVAHDPAVAVSLLALSTKEDRELVVNTWNQTQQPTPAQTVIAAFEAQADTTPDAIAVGNAHDRLTYQQLNRKASAVARALIDQGVLPGDAVGLCTDRSTAVIVGILAIWKAGAAYVPLNPEHPEARIAHQLHESGAAYVVTIRSHREYVRHTSHCVLIDEIVAEAPADQEALTSVARREHAAYVMYTSGSTGLPKGVAVTHANLTNNAHALAEQLGLFFATRPLHCATVTAISTDLGNPAIFPALIAGGCVELIDANIATDPNLFAQHIDQWPIDIIKVTPSHLTALMTAGAERVLPNHTLVLGGEASSWPLVESVMLAQRCRVLNHYGPTETTVGSCTYDVVPSMGTDPITKPSTVPIGRPIANTQCYIVDLAGQPVPLGIPGELWIGGAGVAQGYVGSTEETAARFIANPFHEGRLYRTGDKARWLPDGSIEFLGRVDDQVKIRGFRIEPREIEQVISTHPQVRQVAVIAREDGGGDLRLVAYIVADGSPNRESLRTVVSDSLPHYMMPSAFLFLSRLPLTASGKLDRRALPDPAIDTEGERPYAAPTSPTETQLAAIWCEVLRRDRVGIHDDFFELGGHSLLAAQVVARIRNHFGVQLALHSLFGAPSIALLADEVDALGGGSLDEDELDALLEGLSPEEIEALLDES